MGYPHPAVMRQLVWLRRCTDSWAKGLKGAWLLAMAENARTVYVRMHGFGADLDKKAGFAGFQRCGGSQVVDSRLSVGHKSDFFGRFYENVEKRH